MRFDSDFTQTSGQKNGEWSLWLAVLDGVVYIAGGNRGTGRLRSVEKLLPGAKRCLNLLNYDSVNNRYMHLEVQCSQMSPHLGTWVPKGTFYSFWVPLGPHFLF